MPITLPSVEDDIMKEISADLNIPYNVVRDVVINGQSAFTKKVIESGTFHSVRWRFLGLFKVKPRNVQIKKFMRGVDPSQRFIYRKLIKQGKFFPTNPNDSEKS